MSVKTHPIMLDFPDRFETERLLIRATLPGDGAELNAAIRESQQELSPFLPFARILPEPEETEQLVRLKRLHFLERTDMMMLMTERETGLILGASGLHRFDWRARRFEIGYWIRTSYAGKGLVTEAVHGLTDFAARYLEANRVEIRCDDRNKRSAAVAERAGFTLEGVLRNWKLEEDDTLVNEMIFAKVRGLDF
ncbi:GNAT family N-acetyltransferase [Saccharibacillus kuerlensis]|uniref:Ribosomal-protein-serine acetyltransferase n=1 Tax=Saccharibacillus kuerlensis TaxID=459527 RepID=A0ABQ2KRR3_9BACL|nr:GNAT family N-acetyltransferase [Saccharibacillus kuerlensis]GGN91058.1 ribosomal-protein-serine acetyltransferase [Saccharibacillus kuerlensis]